MREIQAGTPHDRSTAAALLTAAGLPLDGFAEAAEVLVARDADAVIGCAAIEVYADGGLLRSVAVAPGHRGTGLGRAMVDAAIARARALRLPALFLLTTTAADYFPRWGFEVIDRREVPPGVSGSVEFTSACPSSAIVMRRHLAGEQAC